MLTLVVEGETQQISAHHFSELISVAVRIMKDASDGTGLGFNVADLHASAPTIAWAPTIEGDAVDIDAEFAKVVHRITAGFEQLEREARVPDWMSEATARSLHDVSAWFGETEVDGITFRGEGFRRRLTREAHITLDRWLHDESEAVGSVTGIIMTATLRGGPLVSVQDEVYQRAVKVILTRDQLREAGQWIGLRVTASGRMRRDFAGRPTRIRSGTVALVPERTEVTAADAAGLFRSGPPAVEWVREQRDA